MRAVLLPPLLLCCAAGAGGFELGAWLAAQQRACLDSSARLCEDDGPPGCAATARALCDVAGAEPALQKLVGGADDGALAALAALAEGALVDAGLKPAMARRVRRAAAAAEPSSEAAASAAERLAATLDNSWVRSLSEDPAAAANEPNTRAREVLSGHYVHVRPTPLPQPRLVATSREMATELGLSEAELQAETMVRLLSGGTDVPGFQESWATPYALSIYGQVIVPGGSGRKGDGYGDGRAISIGEALVNGSRWELQLKGAGRTPFARTADGRAVLRSSVREFLASEAMHHLGVPTTRALALIVSQTEQSRRP